MSGSTPRKRRAARVRYYFDADVLGLAKVVAGIRPDVTYPGDPGDEVRKRHRPACPITVPATEDLVWIPVVAREGWSIISRDRHIEAHPAESDAVIAYNAKLFTIASGETLDLWGQLEILLKPLAGHRATARTAGTVHLRPVPDESHPAPLTLFREKVRAPRGVKPPASWVCRDRIGHVEGRA